MIHPRLLEYYEKKTGNPGLYSKAVEAVNMETDITYTSDAYTKGSEHPKEIVYMHYSNNPLTFMVKIHSTCFFDICVQDRPKDVILAL